MKDGHERRIYLGRREPTYEGTGKKRPVLKQWADGHGDWDIRVARPEEMKLVRRGLRP